MARADEVPNLTVEILKQIRDEVRGTNQRLSSVDERLMSLESRVEEGFRELRSEVQHTTSVSGVSNRRFARWPR
jgi:hypothetical protein